jgi:transposase
MKELFGCALSAGTLATAVRRCASGLIETELKIKRDLRRSPVIHADETGLRVEGRLHFVHVTSNSRLTHYMAAAGRGRTAMEEAGVLPRYRGTCVHDAWPAYSLYTQCRHALCGAHLLRELTFFAELSEETKAWASRLKGLLLEMKAEVERAGAEGRRRVADDKLAELTQSYDRLIAEGLEAQPPPGVPEPVRRQRATCCCGWGEERERCCCS